MPDLALGTGRGGDLSTPPLPPDGVLLAFSSPAEVSPALHSPTPRPEGRPNEGRLQSSPSRSFQPHHAAFTTTSPMAGCGRGRAETDTAVANSINVTCTSATNSCAACVTGSILVPAATTSTADLCRLDCPFVDLLDGHGRRPQPDLPHTGAPRMTLRPARMPARP